MVKPIETDNAPTPLSAYAQGIEVPAGHRVVHVSGQVGVSLDGEIPVDPARQHELAWQNAMAVLAAAGGGPPPPGGPPLVKTPRPPNRR